MRRLAAHGIALELPSGWSGRLFATAPGAATLHAATFPLALSDGAFGDATTARMPPGGIFLALTEYLPGHGLEPGGGLFETRRIPRRLDATAFSSRGLAHPRPDQAGLQRFFTVAERPFCLYAVLAGGRRHRRPQLAHLEHLLGTIRISPRS